MSLVFIQNRFDLIKEGGRNFVIVKGFSIFEARYFSPHRDAGMSPNQGLQTYCIVDKDILSPYKLIYVFVEGSCFDYVVGVLRLHRLWYARCDKVVKN